MKGRLYMQAIRLVDTAEMPKDQWLVLRRNYMCGSDIAASFGADKYRSKLSVYLEKIGEAPEVEDNEFMYWGRTLEPVIADEFARRTGLIVENCTDFLVHPEHEWAAANVDRIVYENGKQGVLEIKTASEYKLSEWEGESVPDNYLLQLNWYLFVTGLDFGYFAVLIGGNKFKYYRVERDDELINIIVQMASSFWFDHVQAKIPPAFSDLDTAFVNDRYRNSVPKSTVNLETEDKKLVDGARHLKKQMDEVKRQLESFKNQIKGAAKENELIYVDGELVATWKADKNGKRTFKLIGEE